MKDDPEILPIKTKVDEIKDLEDETEKHDHENILKSLKIDNEYYKKKYKSFNRKKVLLIITEKLLGSGSAITTSTMSLINPSIGIVLTSSTALLTSIAILITNEHTPILKIRYTNLRDWMNGITLLYEKILKQSIVDKRIDQKESEKMKKISNHYLDNRSKIIKNTTLRVEDVFGDVILNYSISPEQITKFNKFLAKLL